MDRKMNELQETHLEQRHSLPSSLSNNFKISGDLDQLLKLKDELPNNTPQNVR